MMTFVLFAKNPRVLLFVDYDTTLSFSHCQFI